MKRKVSHSSYKEILPVMCLFLVIMVVITGCSSKKKDHNTPPISVINNIDKGMEQDSMPGMDMPNDSNHHRSQDGIKAVKSDTTANEIYWNTLPTNRTVIARQQVVKPAYRAMSFPISSNGYIALDVRRSRKVPVRVGGRIERLYVKYNYQHVHKGEKLLELYSPELNTYVDEYLYVKRNTTDSVLQRKAKEKLLLLGLSSSQVSQIDKAGQASFTIPVYSPFEGYVLFNPSASSSPGMTNTSNASGSMGNSMNSGTNISSDQASMLSDNSIREGMYVSKDQTLFWINDFQVVWGVLAFTRDNEKYIKKGQVAILESELLPDQSFRAAIQLTEPVYQQGQKFTQARVYIPNTRGRLKQNSLLKANVLVSAQSLMLPASSIYYLGRVAIVWVQTGLTKEGSSIFQSRVVRTGHRSGDEVEILEGIRQDEVVAKDAAYLADSETIINY